MSVEIHSGSTYGPKLAALAEAVGDAVDPDITGAVVHRVVDTGAPKQPFHEYQLVAGARGRVVRAVDDVIASGSLDQETPKTVVVGGAECGVVFVPRRGGFYSETVAAIVIINNTSVTTGVGRAGGVRYPMRDVVSAWWHRGTVGESMSRRLGGDPQDPHAILGKGKRVDQIGQAYKGAIMDATHASSSQKVK